MFNLTIVFVGIELSILIFSSKLIHLNLEYKSALKALKVLTPNFMDFFLLQSFVGFYASNFQTQPNLKFQLS